MASVSVVKFARGPNSSARRSMALELRAGLIAYPYPRKMGASKASFSVGEIIHHQRFDYRGVVVDVDPVFQGTEEWYDTMAISRPPKDAPWYHVLVHGSDHMTYVAERNLEADDDGGPIAHPLLGHFFDEHRDGRYHAKRSLN